jgi:phosphoglycolate phosphatase
MKKLYIFDFDGTLVNTFHDSVIAYNKALAKHGKDIY